MFRPFPIRFLFLLSLMALGTACSNVKVALYDSKKRQHYASDAHEAYLNTPAGKTYLLKKSMIETAREYLGAPYKYGGMDPKKGFDCSGFVYTVARRHQIELPRSSSLMAAAAPHIQIREAAPGDLVFFGDRGRIQHVGIIEKNSKQELMVIHSTNQRGVIHENVLESPYWKKRIRFAVDLASFQ